MSNNQEDQGWFYNAFGRNGWATRGVESTGWDGILTAPFHAAANNNEHAARAISRAMGGDYQSIPLNQNQNHHQNQNPYQNQNQYQNQRRH